MDNGIKRKFLKYLDSKTIVGWSEKINITDFIVSNFKKPNPLSPKTSNDNDPAVFFLKNLKSENLIDYEDRVLSQVNTWMYAIEDVEHKRWFDTLHEPMYVTLTTYYFDNRSLIYPNIPQRIKRYVGTTWLVKKLNKLSMTNIIEMIIAGVVVTLIIYWWHLNAVRI